VLSLSKYTLEFTIIRQGFFFAFMACSA